MEIARNKYLEMLKLRQNNGFIKVVTGIRRVGKSYLLGTIFYNYLINSGVRRDHIIKFAFDSAEDLARIGVSVADLNKNKVSPDKFISYVSSKLIDDDIYYLILDEVQLMDAFEFVLNGLLYKNNVDIYVTGSNSKFLSKDVVTEFAGRGDEIHVLPLSFSEFYAAYNGDKEYALDEYMIYGGLPQTALLPTERQKSAYLFSQINNVYLKDIVARHNLNEDNDLDELFDVLASGLATLTNPNKLANTFRSVKKSKLSSTTIAKYIDYLQESFVINKVLRYDVKGKNYIGTPYKIYFEDVGLRNARLHFRQIENNHIMENIVFNELRYRGYNVDVGVVETRKKDSDGKDVRKQLEIDFVANMGSSRYYIQSAYAIPDQNKWNQEVQAFDNVGDSFKKIVIVGNGIKPRFTEQGYLLIGIKEFLLNSDSLEF